MCIPFSVDGYVNHIQFFIITNNEAMTVFMYMCKSFSCNIYSRSLEFGSESMHTDRFYKISFQNVFSIPIPTNSKLEC